VDTDNWEIDEEDFSYLCGRFGPFSVDLFATRGNAKCERFYSRSWEQGVLGVDAFAQNWDGECIYAAPPPPPVSLVMGTIMEAAESKGLSDILIVPL
jgi:hypothetical protein